MEDPVPHHRRLIARVVLLIAALLGIPALTAASSHATQPATSSFVPGTTCAPEPTTPATVTEKRFDLGAWTLDDGSIGYALAPVVDGRTPELHAATETAVPSTGTTAAVAYLLSHTDSSDIDAVTATAATIAQLTAPDPTITDCLTARQAAIAEKSWTTAQQLAGPYTVTITGPATPITLGAAVTLKVSITSSAGLPVPAVTVRMTIPHAILTASTATTNKHGVATFTFTTRHTSTVKHLAATASVRAISSIVETSDPTHPGKVNLLLSGKVATAAATATVAVNTTANPHLAAHLSAQTILPGSQVTGTLVVTGLNGHAANVSQALLGPEPFPTSGSCASIAAATWATAPTVAGSTLSSVTASHPQASTNPTPSAPASATPTRPTVPTAQVTTDGPLPSFTTTVAKPGCYLLSGTATTVNAVPNKTVNLAVTTLAVLPVTITATASEHGVTGGGTQHATVTATSGDVNVHPTLTGASGTLYRNIQPDDGRCPTTGWQNDTDTAAVALTGQGSATLTASTARVSAQTCYAFGFTGTVTAAPFGSTSFTVQPGLSGTTLLLVHPTVQTETTSTSQAAIGRTVRATVHVYGTLTQPARVHLALVRSTNPPDDCWNNGWPHSITEPGDGPTITTHGDGTYTLTSPKLPANSCFSLVPHLTLLNNPTVAASGLNGDDASIVYGAPRTTKRIPDITAHIHHTHRVYLRAAIIAIALLVIAVIGVAVLARRNARADAALGSSERWLF